MDYITKNIISPWSPYTFQLILAHVFGLVGLYNILQGQVLASTIIFLLVKAELGCLGATIGAHRLWSHRAFKANTPLRIILMLCQSMSHQDTIWQWVEWHRVHHKYVDTDKDPHDSTKGVYYSHIGWLLTYDTDKFEPIGSKVDMSDLMKDPVVMWQKKYVQFNGPLFHTLTCIPAFICWYFLGESVFNSGCVTYLSSAYCLHRIFLINSAAHLWGSRPYDKSMYPTENKFVSFAICGEGWHNYHHSFPHDYKAAELGLYRFNFSTAIIDFFAWIGWAYDLRTASPEAVRSRVARTGDKHLHETQTFG